MPSKSRSRSRPRATNDEVTKCAKRMDIQAFDEDNLIHHESGGEKIEPTHNLVTQYDKIEAIGDQDEPIKLMTTREFRIWLDHNFYFVDHQDRG